MNLCVLKCHHENFPRPLRVTSLHGGIFLSAAQVAEENTFFLSCFRLPMSMLLTERENISQCVGQNNIPLEMSAPWNLEPVNMLYLRWPEGPCWCNVGCVLKMEIIWGSAGGPSKQKKNFLLLASERCSFRKGRRGGALGSPPRCTVGGLQALLLTLRMEEGPHEPRRVSRMTPAW